MKILHVFFLFIETIRNFMLATREAVSTVGRSAIPQVCMVPQCDNTGTINDDPYRNF